MKEVVDLDGTTGVLQYPKDVSSFSCPGLTLLLIPS